MIRIGFYKLIRKSADLELVFNFIHKFFLRDEISLYTYYCMYTIYLLISSSLAVIYVFIQLFSGFSVKKSMKRL